MEGVMLLILLLLVFLFILWVWNGGPDDAARSATNTKLETPYVLRIGRCFEDGREITDHGKRQKMLHYMENLMTKDIRWRNSVEGSIYNSTYSRRGEWISQFEGRPLFECKVMNVVLKRRKRRSMGKKDSFVHHRGDNYIICLEFSEGEISADGTIASRMAEIANNSIRQRHIDEKKRLWDEIGKEQA